MSEPPELSGDVLSTDSNWCWRRAFRVCGTSDGVMCSDRKPIRVSVSPMKPVMSSLARAQRSKNDSHHSGYDCWNASKLSEKNIKNDRRYMLDHNIVGRYKNNTLIYNTNKVILVTVHKGTKNMQLYFKIWSISTYHIINI